MERRIESKKTLLQPAVPNSAFYNRMADPPRLHKQLGAKRVEVTKAVFGVGNLKWLQPVSEN